ncbi:MAG: Crp/Fnr family transcriptional regulator [Oscillospiraceae bacterium]|nr:Crp/Fnr family transcriptional regulator [Oscillospiraceae bacterium]
MKNSVYPGSKRREASQQKLEAVLTQSCILLPDDIKRNIVYEHYSPGELIRAAYDDVQNMSILFDDRIFITNSSVEGREFTYAREQTLTLIGDLEYLSGNLHYASSVIAKTDVELATLSFQAFDRWLVEEDFRRYVLRCIAEKGFRAAARHGQDMFYTPVQKVVSILLNDLRYLNEKRSVYVVNYTHHDLAELTGLSDRTINRAIKRLVEQDLIRIEHGRVLVRASDIHTLSDLIA